MTILELLKKKVNYPEPEDWPVPISKKDLENLIEICTYVKSFVDDKNFLASYPFTNIKLKERLERLNSNVSGEDRAA